MPVPNGKTLDSDSFGSDSGWTKTTTFGSYSVSGGKGNFTAGSGGLNSLGFVRTTGVTSLPFAKYSMDFNAESGTNHNFIISLRTDATFDYNSTFGVNVNGGGILYAYDATAFDVGFGAISTAVYNVAVVIQPNYSAKLYVNGNYLYTSSNFSGPLITDDPLYWQVHVDKCNGNGVLQVDNFLVTDQSCMEIERSTNPSSGFSQIATVDLGVQSYSDNSGLSKGRNYYYRFRNNRGGDTGPYSSVVTAKTFGSASGNTPKKKEVQLGRS